MVNYYLVKEENLILTYDRAELIKQNIGNLDHPIRRRIVDLVSKRPMYPAEIAKKLNLHEQKIYYHIKKMMDAGILYVYEKKEVRGTVAKRLSLSATSFVSSFCKDWRSFSEITEDTSSTHYQFLSPFIKDGIFDAKIVVGNPDPHGPHKARARDGHYAIETALFLGQFCKLGKEFSVSLDVDISLDKKSNLVVVGGPVTNLISSQLNDHLPSKFSEKRPWGIISKGAVYSDDSVGIIARIQNPIHPKYWILVLAGVRFVGTKAAVMAFTKNTELVLDRFSGQKKFSCIVQGFDLDGDGKIDSTEILN